MAERDLAVIGADQARSDTPGRSIEYRLIRKARLKAASMTFKDNVGPEALAKAYAAMIHGNRLDRYRR